MIALFAKIGLGALGIVAAGVAVSIMFNSGRPPIPERAEDRIRVTTFNVHWIAMRRDDGPWSRDGFTARSGPMQAAVEAIAPDIFALQEAESFPGTNRDGTNLVVEFLTATFPEYGLAASGTPDAFPPTQPILYRQDLFEMTEQGWFFFSDTPDTIYARTFNGSFPAFASWAEFQPLDGRPPFRVVNIHTDYASRTNRRRSAALVRDRVAPWVAEGLRVVVVGDMNALAGSYTLRTMEDAGLSFLPVRGSTVHFNRGLNLFGAIDHIGLSDGLSSDGTTVVRDRFGDVWPSDHYPVFADITIEP